MTIEVLMVLGIVLAAEFVNGYTDAPNATATAVATGLLTRTQALMWAASANMMGLIPALFLGAAVAETIGKGIIDPAAVSIGLIAAAMCAVIIWGRLSALVGLPVSKSHALFAALAGAAFLGGGFDALVGSGWIKIAYGVGISIVVASSFSYITASIFGILQKQYTPSPKFWRRTQLGTLTLVAGMHGWNDGLKFVGVFALVLFLSGITTEFRVTASIILLCAIVMGAGTLCGGWRIVARIKKMVHDDCKPLTGVAAESIAAVCIGASAFGGVPMSTTHTVVSSIAGAKAAISYKTVSWKTVGLIVWGWVLTIVFCALAAAVFAYIGWKLIIAMYVLAELGGALFVSRGKQSAVEVVPVAHY